ncbi:HXA4 protein, partial [Geococcyx californianus]|nr:HXA4 protein [Geococcyx californianus]
MTMSSFLINSNYIEPKFPPCEEYTQQHSGSAGGSAGFHHPHHPHPHHPHHPQPPPHLHAAPAGPALPEYFPRQRRDPGYQAPAAGPPAGPPAEALYPAQAPSYPPQAPYSYNSAAPGPEQPPPGSSPPPPPAKGHPGPPQPLVGGHALQRRCEAAPAAGAGCPLLPDKSPPGLKGKEPVVYPWMKKIHVSTVNPNYNGGEPKRSRTAYTRQQVLELEKEF